MKRLRYRWLVPAASRLPESCLRFLDRHVPVCVDHSDGWSFWMDASYLKWCRNDMRAGSA